MEILNNPTSQTILGSVLGAVIGWVLSLASSKPTPMYSNLTIIEIKTEVKNKTNNSEDVDNSHVILLLIVALILATLCYVKFNNEIYRYIYLYEVVSLAFIGVVFILSLVFGRINSKEWLTRVLVPIIIFVLSIFIFKYLRNNIPEELILQSNTLKAFEFIKELTSFGRNYLISELISFILTSLVSILSLINFINYFSLMNLRGDRALTFWMYIYRKTEPLSGVAYYISSLFILITVIIIQSDWFKSSVLNS